MIINSFNIILASLFALVVFRNLRDALTDSHSKQVELTWQNAELNKLMTTVGEGSKVARAEADQVQAILQSQLDESKTIARISEALRGEQDLVTLSKTVLRELCASL